jgi:putative DNA primase/helicase
MSERVQSESDAAHAFVLSHVNQVRFVPEKAMWLIRRDDLWAFDEAKGIEGLIRRFLDKLTGTDPRWKGSLSVVRNVKGLAETDPSLHVAVTEIDARQYLLGTPAGVFDLKKGRRISPRVGTYVTKRTSIDPAFDRDCTKWRQFLRQVFQKDRAKIDYFQRFCGYLLTGSVKEQKLLVIHGPGGNGKFVLVNTVAGIIGDYHKEALPETFVESKGKSHETAMAFLAGARFVTSGESDQGGLLNEATVKRATGADLISARFLYKNPFSYRPTFKIWLTTNHLPRLRSVGPDMRRRIQLLELDFVPSKPDLDLERKLQDEHDAILAWMIKGAVQWMEHGLSPPASIIDPTAEYFEEQDTLGTWLQTRVRKVEDATTPTAHLCASYNRYLEERGLPPIDTSYFGRQLGAQGIRTKQVRPQRVRSAVGIRLRMNT